MNLKHLVLATSLVASAGASADVSEEVTYNFTLEEGGRFSIENVNGDVTVVGASGSDVKIVAFKKAPDQESLDDIRILIDDSPRSIRVETEYKSDEDRGWFSWHIGGDKGSVTYLVTVPSETNLDDVESVNGDLEISGVSGLVKASTVNGNIEARDLADSADIETVNGTVSASFVSFGGAQKANCESVNGKLVINLPADADTSVSAETINGGIDGSDFGLKVNKGFVGRDLDGDIGNGTARLSLNTVNGAIKIRSN